MNHKNLLEICVEAAKNKCTVGEMTSAMERVFGRHTCPLKQSVVFIVKQ